MHLKSLIDTIDSIEKNQYLNEQVSIKLWKDVGLVLNEAQLTSAQVQQIFQQIEQNLTGNTTNRSALGKAKDTAAKINKAWEDLKTKIQNSKPVANFDQLISDQLSKIGMGAADPSLSGNVSSWVQKYRDFAEKHPIAQGAIYAVLIAITGLSGAGVGGAAALGLLKMADKLIQGQKFSSAAYQGAKTGALAYGASKVADFVKGANNVTTAGDTPNQFKDMSDDEINRAANKGEADAAAVSGQDISGTTGVQQQQALANNPELTPNQVPQQDVAQQDIPQKPGPELTIVQGNPKAAEAWAKLQQKFDSGELLQKQNRAGYELRKMAIDIGGNDSRRVENLLRMQVQQLTGGAGGDPSNIVDAFRKTSTEDWAKVPGTSQGSQMVNTPDNFEESISLSESQVQTLFSNIEHSYELSTVKYLASLDEGVFDKIKQFGTNLTTKITADKLMKAWKSAKGSTDSEYIKRFLSRQGIDQNVIDNSFNAVLNPSQPSATGAQPAQPAQPATTGAQPAQPAQPATTGAQPSSIQVPTTAGSGPRSPGRQASMQNTASGNTLAAKATNPFNLTPSQVSNNTKPSAANFGQNANYYQNTNMNVSSNVPKVPTTSKKLNNKPAVATVESVKFYSKFLGIEI